MKPHHSALKHVRLNLLVALAFGGAALAGCLGIGNALDGETPTAELTVDETELWTGEEFTFDASTSADPNGQITRWHFDFGDGDTFETGDEAEAMNVSHTYNAGGRFDVTLTVTDDGTNQTGKKSATHVMIVTVHDDAQVSPRVHYAAPEVAGEVAKSTFEFRVNEGAVAYQANITISSMIVVGTSTVTLRVLTPAGDVLEEKEVTVEAGSQVAEDLAGRLAGHGDFTLEIEATSGASSTDGMMRVHYSEDPRMRDTT